MQRVLVVDDESAIVNLLAFILEDGGYQVRSVGRGDTALEVTREWNPHLVILDIGLPGLNGLEVCRRLHAENTPVLVVSSHDQDDQVVAGLEEGADDYVTKPFNHRELLLRVEKLLQRTVPSGGDDSRLAVGKPLKVRDLLIDPAREEVTRAGATIQLTRTEYRILALLARTPEQPVQIETILARVWNNPDWEGGPEMVKVNIRRLRRKIEPDPNHPSYILNRRGLGYYLAAES